MNYNSYSVILSTLKLQGALTRKQLWEFSRASNLFPSSMDFKKKMDTLLTTERIGRKSEYQFNPKKNMNMKNLFKFEMIADHDRNSIPQEVLSRVQISIDKTLEEQRLQKIREEQEKADRVSKEEKLKAKLLENKEQEKVKKEEQQKQRIQQAMEKSSKIICKEIIINNMDIYLIIVAQLNFFFVIMPQSFIRI
ncbi:hypothetical protein DFA_03317 [Cavenderia fasciculata]|uniref:Uncharacterized protein n=1 Tax=Cavenderia fasciculata TaxID=261658 RepID=F4PH87_CACFS|nr:uncharacterized protein DFA_03317 [Cavenderia fasciculata]EGG25071.1 hypothetical protein DFA_03317 [Cavenderia fasciculata]|eukprot:XP_004362922.1 hypothetical protein DFA_03317 [Cavenderia fasciculata]